MTPFKTRRLKEDVPPPRWLIWLKKGLSLAVRLRVPMMLWYRDFKKEQMEKMKEERRMEFDIKHLIIGGGVSANTFIKSEMEKMTKESFPNVQLHVPDSHLLLTTPL
jgi:hypothetical protein